MIKTRTFILSIIISLVANSGLAQCINVDLQTVSITPKQSSIGTGQTTEIMVSLKNNNVCPIPIGQAIAQVTISSIHLALTEPIVFKDPCGQWTLQKVVSDEKHHNLFFQNNAGPIPPGGQLCTFYFTVSGKKTSAKPFALTAVSSLSLSATTADVVGNNQYAESEIKVTGAAVATSTALNHTVSVFNIKAEECNAYLNWKTVSTTIIDHFEMEHSLDGVEFVNVGTIAAKLPDEGVAYEFSHNKGNGKSFYRLKIIGKDGQFHYSKPVTVTTTCTVKKAF